MAHVGLRECIGDIKGDTRSFDNGSYGFRPTQDRPEALRAER